METLQFNEMEIMDCAFKSKADFIRNLLSKKTLFELYELQILETEYWICFYKNDDIEHGLGFPIHQ